MFTLSFASVYTAITPYNSAPFEHRLQSLTTVDINRENVNDVFNALDVSSAMGPDCKACHFANKLISHIFRASPVLLERRNNIRYLPPPPPNDSFFGSRTGNKM